MNEIEPSPTNRPAPAEVSRVETEEPSHSDAAEAGQPAGAGCAPTPGSPSSAFQSFVAHEVAEIKKTGIMPDYIKVATPRTETSDGPTSGAEVRSMEDGVPPGEPRRYGWTATKGGFLLRICLVYVMALTLGPIMGVLEVLQGIRPELKAFKKTWATRKWLPWKEPKPDSEAKRSDRRHA